MDKCAKEKKYISFLNHKQSILTSLSDIWPGYKTRFDCEKYSYEKMKDDHGNWYVGIIPQEWTSRGKLLGLYYSYRYRLTNTEEHMRLYVNVENPLPPDKRKRLKEEVARDLQTKTLLPSGFKVWPHAGIQLGSKLIEAPKFGMDENIAINYFRDLVPFNNYLSAKLQELY